MKIWLLLLLGGALFADDIQGFWKNMGQNGNTQCVIAVYPYEDKYYGRIIATYNEKGILKESIYKPSDRAPGVVGHPFYCGLDLLWDLADMGTKYVGKIIDPEKGNIYNSEVWVDGDNLIIRGKLLFFGRSMTWYPVKASDFPAHFKLPDVSTFIPDIPQVD